VNKRLPGILFLLSLTACSGHYYLKEGNQVTFFLKRPEAQKVVLYCSMDGFAGHPATRVSGRWEVRLPAERTFTYFYRLDDELYLPDCAARETDDFGSENCVFDPHW
jgi:hypothetical protein